MSTACAIPFECLLWRRRGRVGRHHPSSSVYLSIAHPPCHTCGRSCPAAAPTQIAAPLSRVRKCAESCVWSSCMHACMHLCVAAKDAKPPNDPSLIHKHLSPSIHPSISTYPSPRYHHRRARRPGPRAQAAACSPSGSCRGRRCSVNGWVVGVRVWVCEP